MYASSRGNEDIVEMLVTAGAKIDFRNKDRLTALELARDGGHDGIVELLIRQQQKERQAHVSTKIKGNEHNEEETVVSKKLSALDIGDNEDRYGNGRVRSSFPKEIMGGNLQDSSLSVGEL